MRIVFTVLICLAFVSAHAQKTKTYRWVDAQGVTHFSDQPDPNSKDPESDSFEINAPNVIQSRQSSSPSPRLPAGQSDMSESGGETDEPRVEYQSITISSPKAEQTLWNIGGVLGVQVSVEPALQSGDGIMLYYDQQAVSEQPTASTAFSLDEVYRGEHTLRAVVLGPQGRELIASTPIRFYVQQSIAR